jgi:hypothetical protein
MFALYPDDLGIILTYRCMSACRHCLYNCGPRRSKESMSPESLREALEAITLWPRPPMVHFTGGEPFLHFELLLEGARIATELGIRCYVETSAAWCTDRDAAVERPTPLARFEEMLGLESARAVLWDGYGILSGGRAGYELGHLTTRRSAAAFARLTCARELLYAPHSHFDLYGNYVPSFCGGLAVGSWHNLPRLLDDFQSGRYPPLIDKLVKDGPHGLAAMAQQEYGYRYRSDGYAGKCHLCVDVRRHLAETGGFEELRPQGFYDHF